MKKVQITAEREEELFGIALWAIRRLPTRYCKRLALEDLLCQYSKNDKEYEIISTYIDEVEKTGGF